MREVELGVNTKVQLFKKFGYLVLISFWWKSGPSETNPCMRNDTWL